MGENALSNTPEPTAEPTAEPTPDVFDLEKVTGTEILSVPTENTPMPTENTDEGAIEFVPDNSLEIIESLEDLYTLLSDRTDVLIDELECVNSPETIWEKPIEEYTPTEGLLLILVVLLLWLVITRFIGGMFA